MPYRPGLPKGTAGKKGRKKKSSTENDKINKPVRNCKKLQFTAKREVYRMQKRADIVKKNEKRKLMNIPRCECRAVERKRKKIRGSLKSQSEIAAAPKQILRTH